MFRWRTLILLGCLTLGTVTPISAERSGFKLSDQTSKVYYDYGIAAGEVLVEGGTEIVGNVHANGGIDLKKDSLVVGDVSAAGRVSNRGTVDGEIREGAEPLPLPGLPDEARLRAMADRVVEGDVTLEDEIVDDVVLVVGNVRVVGNLGGDGTILSTRDIRIGKDDDGAPETVALEAGTRVSLIALEDVHVGKDRPFRGVLRAGRDVTLEKNAAFEGVIVAGRRLHVKKDARLTFFDFDQKSPLLALLAPADGSSLPTATPEVSATFTDEFSGIDRETVRLFLDGEDRTAEAAVDSANLAFTPPDTLAEGPHTVAVVVRDNSGNETRGEASFVVDTIAPVVTFISPTDGENVEGLTIEVTVEVADQNPVEVTISGQPASPAGGFFSAVIDLSPGPNVLVAVATDGAGNSGSASITVQTDSTPPSLALTAPPAGVFLADGRPTLELNYEDGGSGVDTSSLAFTVNGSLLEVSCDLDGFGGSCFPLADLPDGTVDLVASLSDFAGNTASASLRLTVDTAGVEVEITDPADGLVVQDEEIGIFGAIGPGVADVQVNDVTALLSGSSFSATVPLREGTNMVVALATKTNGNTGTATVEVTRDVAAPTIKIDGPRNGFRAVQDRITVTGLVNDIVSGGTKPLVLVNGFEATVAGGAFLLMDLPLKRGDNVIEAVATDSVGNEGRDTITVTFQPVVGPRLRIASGDGQFDKVGTPLVKPLEVVVEDDFGIPVAGRVVRFEVTRNSGTLRSKPSDEPRRVVQVPTDGAGRASVLLTLGDTAGEGNNRVRATGLGVAGEVEFCATALGLEPDRIVMVGGDNQRGLVGNPLATPLEALVTDRDGNPAASIDVTFEVVKGFGTLDGQPSLVRTTSVDGVARAVLTLGSDPGINNNVVAAAFEGLEGLPATATASGLPAGDPAQTRFSGVVLDNGETPIPGARVFLVGTDRLTLTDEEGQFLLENVPVGHVDLVVDPRQSPRPETFPPLHFETVTVAGQENTLGQPILIPALDTANSKVVGGSEDVTLTMEGVEGLSLTVFANSVTFPDGSRTGQLSISQVHLDKVPMAPPSGSIFIPPAWTIQPAGVEFDPPARIAIPNNGLPPGRVIDIFQFDHALNEFVEVGKGTVSDDGFNITSDPGFGITRAGWGGGGQPPAPTGSLIGVNRVGGGGCGPGGPAGAPAGSAPFEKLACLFAKVAYCEAKYGSPCRVSCGSICDIVDNPSGFQACLGLCSVEQARCLAGRC